MQKEKEKAKCLSACRRSLWVCLFSEKIRESLKLTNFEFCKNKINKIMGQCLVKWSHHKKIGLDLGLFITDREWRSLKLHSALGFAGRKNVVVEPEYSA